MTIWQATAGRLAFFAHDLRGGGAERAVVRLVNAAVRHGAPVDLVLIRHEGPFLSELDPRVRVVALPSRRTAFSIFGLARYIDETRPLALIASMTHVNVAAVLARRLARHAPRLVLVEHNQFDRNYAQKKGVVRLAYRVAPRLYRSADVIAGVSQGVGDSIAAAMRAPRDQVAVLYNPVVTEELFRRAAEPVDHPWLTSPAAPVLLAVGRLSAAKNYPLLLGAFARLRARRDARLIVLGEGPLRGALQETAASLGVAADVDFAGFHPNPFAFMRACDAFVMSSDWEGHPTVMVEAMACGAPIVSTDCRSGPSEILNGGRFGRLTPPGDAAALADALAATLDAPGDPAPRVARAKEFNDDAAIDAYLAVAGWKLAQASQEANR